MSTMNRHIQVSGCVRSGTTLMYCSLMCLDGIEYHPDSPTHSGNINVARYIALFGYPRDPSKSFVGKLPFSHIGDHRQLICDDVALILMVRDGRDVCLSRYWREPERYWVSPDEWMSANEKVLDLLDFAPNQCLMVRYEDLVSEHDAVLERVARFVGRRKSRSWAEVKDYWDPRGYPARAMNGARICRPRDIDPGQAGKWLRNPDELVKVLDGFDEHAFAEMSERLGYDPGAPVRSYVT